MSVTEPRKQPRQERAQHTVEALVDAAARILVEEGYAKASTNRIAQRAGVSIGSLYQYFPDKDAIIAAVARRHTNRMIESLATMTLDLATAPIADAIRTYIRAMVRAHSENPRLDVEIVHFVLRQGVRMMEETHARSRQLVRAYLELHRHELRPTDLDSATFVLVSSVEAVVHGALLEEGQIQPGVEAELVRMIIAYLLPDASLPEA